MPDKFVQIQSTNLRDAVVSQMRLAIIEGNLKPGDHIVEKTLTSELGVSRTPVREALILLEREGLVRSETNRGFFVRVFTADDVQHIFTMRTTLENFAAELAIDHLTDDDFHNLEHLIDEQERAIERMDFKAVRSKDMSFHGTFLQKSQHPLLIRNWSELVAQIAALLYARAEAMPTFDEYQVIEDHKAILDAYRARDVAAVKAQNERINQRVSLECQRAVERS